MPTQQNPQQAERHGQDREQEAQRVDPEVLRALAELIHAQTAIDPQRVTENITLADLGISSLDALNLVFDVEQKFGIDINAAVDFSAVANPQHEDTQGLVLDAHDDTPIANAVLPELSKLGASKDPTDAARVFKHSNTVIQKAEYAVSYRRIELP